MKLAEATWQSLCRAMGAAKVLEGGAPTFNVMMIDDSGAIDAGYKRRNDGSGTMSVVNARGSDVTSYCMTTSFGDLDGDAVLDLYVSGTGQHFALVNVGGTFINKATSWDFPDFEPLEMPWAQPSRVASFVSQSSAVQVRSALP